MIYIIYIYIYIHMYIYIYIYVYIYIYELRGTLLVSLGRALSYFSWNILCVCVCMYVRACAKPDAISSSRRDCLNSSSILRSIVAS